MNLKTKIKLFGSLALISTLCFLLLVMSAFAVLSYDDKEKDKDGNVIFHFEEFSSASDKYREYIFKQCDYYDISDYSYCILAILDCTSAGAVSDVMGAEYFTCQTKYPKGNTFDRYEYNVTDAYYSIDCGIQHFKYLLKKANVSSIKNKDKLLKVYQAYHLDTIYHEMNSNYGNTTYTTPYGEKFVNGFSYSESNTKQFCNDNNLNMEVTQPFCFNVHFATDVADLVAKLQNSGNSNFICPLVDSWSLTSDFGYRIHPTLGYKKLHSGLDMATSSGNKIVATADGYVQWSGWGTGSSASYGIYVSIKHNDTYDSLYAHMSETAVKNGEYVRQGQVIGYVGSTGRSTGAHLHFSIKKNGEWVDPADYISTSGN